MRKNSILAAIAALTMFSANAQQKLLPNNGDHIYLVCNDSAIYGFGKNHKGQVGVGSTTYQNTPAAINNINKVIDATAGLVHSFFIKDDQTIWATGENDYGQLGLGNLNSTDSPLNLTTLNGMISQISASSRHTLFLKNDSTVLACGSNTDGALGLGNNNNQSTPTPINTLNNIIAVSASCDNGPQHSLFLKNDSTVWACGYNVDGGLGIGTNTNSNIPVQISISGVVQIAAGNKTSYFLKSDGTVWSCGFNSSGQLGLGNTTNQNTLVQIPNLNNIIKISAGSMHALFLKADSTVWACGNNFVSQLGSSSFGMYSDVVVQVPSISNVVDIEAGFQHSLFLKNDGAIWACGFGPFGQSTTLSALTQITSPCNTTASIEQINQNDLISIYPNPTISSINFSIQTNIQLTNLTGQIVANETNVNTLDITDQPTGIYFVTLTNEKGQVLQRSKIVKQ